MTDVTPNYKTLQQVIDTETYRTDTSTLFAYDESNNQYLFRALNSNYFLQNDNDESIEILDMDDAEKVWESMPSKYIQYCCRISKTSWWCRYRYLY